MRIEHGFIRLCQCQICAGFVILGLRAQIGNLRLCLSLLKFRLHLLHLLVSCLHLLHFRRHFILRNHARRQLHLEAPCEFAGLRPILRFRDKIHDACGRLRCSVDKGHHLLVRKRTLGFGGRTNGDSHPVFAHRYIGIWVTRIVDLLQEHLVITADNRNDPLCVIDIRNKLVDVFRATRVCDF